MHETLHDQEENNFTDLCQIGFNPLLYQVRLKMKALLRLVNMGYPRKLSSNLDRYLESNPKTVDGNRSKELECALRNKHCAVCSLSTIFLLLFCCTLVASCMRLLIEGLRVIIRAKFRSCYFANLISAPETCEKGEQ
jgi:hypothetical protein